MRLIAWNCAMGFERKLAALSALKPDIAVLSEVACPEKLRSQLPTLAGLPIIWVGNNPTRASLLCRLLAATLNLILHTDHPISSLRLFMLMERNRFACLPRGTTMTARKA